MPYQSGSRLSGEKASKLGHLEVLKSELVNELCKTFEENHNPDLNKVKNWIPIKDNNAKPLPVVFAVDGSIQIIEQNKPPYKALAFVKTALLRIDNVELEKIDPNNPHPLALKDLMIDASTYHATVFPLRNVSLPGENNYNAIRKIIFDSLKDPSLKEEPMQTLKWLAYETWSGKKKMLPKFKCPHCSEDEATLHYNEEIGNCPSCKKEIYLTDMLGFHQEMGDDSAPNSVASNYMMIHETLMLFTGIRMYWEQNRNFLSECLFIKDGPLSIRAQYSKLVAPIRRFLIHARDEGHPIYILGQEKSGSFFDHLQLIGSSAPEDISSFFQPGDIYIKTKIQHRPESGALYGKDTNYGAKIFYHHNGYHKMVLNIPVGEPERFENPKPEDLIGYERIFATLPRILSNRFEGAILPIELANGIASLSTYPSSRILTVFAEAKENA